MDGLAGILFRLAELERKLRSLVRLGRIEALDEATARVTVRTGELVTDWVPWLTQRAGADRSTWMPEPGEQVLLVAPEGDVARAVALPSIYQNSAGATSTDRDATRIIYADGTMVEYDRTQHRLFADVKGSAKILTTKHLDAEVGGDLDVEAAGTGRVKTAGLLELRSDTRLTISAPDVDIFGNSPATGDWEINLTNEGWVINNGP